MNMIRRKNHQSEGVLQGTARLVAALAIVLLITQVAAAAPGDLPDPAPEATAQQQAVTGTVADAETGDPIDPDAFYDYEPERGPVPNRGEGRVALRGSTLLAIAAEDYREPGVLQQSKQLMRLLINHRLDQQPLHSRNVYRELQQL